jgi:sugar lactone lactonase YvrE
MLGQGTLAASSPVTQFDARGKELRSWYLPIGYPSGIAFDRVKQVLYVTELLSAEVYTINVLEKGGGPHYLAEVWGAKRAGPVAVDTGTGKIFVADRFTGNVYQMIPPAYRSKLLVGDLGEPSGLAVSPGGQDLYVADHFKRCIWIVRLDEKTAHATKFLAPDLRGPTGVAVDGDGVVWIADESAVFGVTKQGKLLHTIR